MPLMDGFATRTAQLAQKGEGHIHSDKWHSCWEKVQAKGHSSESAAAICTSSLGYAKSVNPEHRQKKKKIEAPTTLTYGFASRSLIYKSNQCHNPAGSSAGGQFCASGGSSIEIPSHRPYLNANMKPSEMMWAYVKEKWGSTVAQADLVDAVVNATGKQGFVPGKPQRRNAPRGTLSDQKRGVLAWMDWMDKQK